MVSFRTTCAEFRSIYAEFRSILRIQIQTYIILCPTTTWRKSGKKITTRSTRCTSTAGQTSSFKEGSKKNKNEFVDNLLTHRIPATSNDGKNEKQLSASPVSSACPASPAGRPPLNSGPPRLVPAYSGARFWAFSSTDKTMVPSGSFLTLLIPGCSFSNSSRIRFCLVSVWTRVLFSFCT